MLRFLLMAIVSIFILSVFRLIAGAMSKGFSEMVDDEKKPPAGNQGSPGEGPPRSAPAAAGGELKRDPVCGTFIPMSTAVTRTVNGKQVYFCSNVCRDQYLG